MNFKEWIDKRTKLAIFDFDQTLANTPLKPENFKNKNGSDWYSSDESLQPPHYYGEVNKKIVNIFKKYKKDPTIKSVMLTGRQNVISDRVRKILQANGLHGKRIIPDSNPDSTIHQHHPKDMHPNSHDEYYKGDHFTEPDYPLTVNNKPDGNTIAHKTYIIRKLMNPNYVELEIFEDRNDHIPEFVNLCNSLIKEYKNLRKVTINHITSPNNIHKIELI